MIKKTSPQAFFFGQEFDRFCQSGNTGIGRRKRTRIRTPHLFAHIVHFVPVILGSNERASLAKQNGINKSGPIAKPSISQHLNAAIDNAVGFPKARTYGSESTSDSGVLSQGGTHPLKKKLEPSFPILARLRKVDFGINVLDNKMYHIFSSTNVVINDTWVRVNFFSQLTNRPTIYAKFFGELQGGIADRSHVNCWQAGCLARRPHIQHLSICWLRQNTIFCTPSVTRSVCGNIQVAASAKQRPGNRAGGEMTEQSPENKKSKRKAPHPLFRLLDFAGPYKILTVVGCALSGLHSLLAVMPLVCVWFIMSQFVAVAPQWSEASGAAFYAWLAVGFAVAGVVVYFAALMCTHIAAFRTGNNMRKAATHHLSKVPLGYYDEHSTGELRRVIDGCAGQTESVLAHKFPDFVGALITPVVFVVVMFIFDWAMGLACLVPIAVSFACIWRMMGGGGSDENSSYLTFVSNYQQALNRMNAAATEYVRGMPVVKVFQQTVDSFNAFKEAILQYRDMAHGYSKLCEKPQVVQIVAINSTFAVLVPASILLAGAAGDFASFFTDFLFYVVFSAVTTSMMTKILYASEAAAMAQDAVMRIEGILSTPEMPCCSAKGGRASGTCDIVFEGVSFTYPGADAPAVKNVSFAIPEGETMALVGRREEARAPLQALFRGSGTSMKDGCLSAVLMCGMFPVRN